MFISFVSKLKSAILKVIAESFYWPSLFQMQYTILSLWCGIAVSFWSRKIHEILHSKLSDISEHQCIILFLAKSVFWRKRVWNFFLKPKKDLSTYYSVRPNVCHYNNRSSEYLIETSSYSGPQASNLAPPPEEVHRHSLIIEFHRPKIRL